LDNQLVAHKGNEFFYPALSRREFFAQVKDVGGRDKPGPRDGRMAQPARPTGMRPEPRRL